MIDTTEWVAAKAAVERIMRATGQSAGKSLDAIIAFVKTGDIQARTLVLTEEIHRQGSSKQKSEVRNATVPLWVWDDFMTRGSATLNWQSGVFSVRGFHDGRQMTVTLTGVQFEARGLDLLDPPSTPERIQLLPPSSAGRPTGSWWEDCIIDVFTQIHFGDLTPTRQRQVEAAMFEWMSARNLSAAVSTVRKRARKVWQAIHREDE